MIEKGRHLRPKIERERRLCINCSSEMENEAHFLISCPVYSSERSELFEVCRRKARKGVEFDRIPTDQQKFIFYNYLRRSCFANYLKCCFIKREKTNVALQKT